MEKKEQQGELGDDLRSQDVAIQVPSALAGLTAGFEKGPGVPPPLKTPRNHPAGFHEDKWLSKCCNSRERKLWVKKYH